MTGSGPAEPAPQATGAARFLSTKMILSLGLALLGLWIISGFLPALIWAGIIAIAIDPLYLKAMRSAAGARNPNLLALVATICVAIVLIAPIALGMTQIARETSNVVRWIGEAQRSGIPVPQWVGQLPIGGSEVASWWQTNLASPAGAAAQLHRLESSGWFTQSGLIGKNIVHRTVIFAFTLLSLFFFLRDRESIVSQTGVAGVRLLGASSERLARQAVLSVRGTIDGLVLVGLGEGAIMTLVYVLLGVPSALLLGLLTAVAAIIPFGAFVMFLVAAALLLVEGQAGAAIAVIVLGLLVVLIADHFVRPALIGGATRLPFLWVLIGILGGVETLGLLGLFVGPSTMALLYLLWNEYIGRDPQHTAVPDVAPPSAES